MSSRFSEDRVHQLQTSIRHASRSPPTKRGGHLPPPTLIPSIPITRVLSCRRVCRLPVQRNIRHRPRLIAGSARVQCKQFTCHARVPCEMRAARVNPTLGEMRRSPGDEETNSTSASWSTTRRVSPLSGTAISRDSHCKTAYFRHFV